MAAKTINKKTTRKATHSAMAMLDRPYREGEKLTGKSVICMSTCGEGNTPRAAAAAAVEHMRKTCAKYVKTWHETEPITVTAWHDRLGTEYAYVVRPGKTTLIRQPLVV